MWRTSGYQKYQKQQRNYAVSNVGSITIILIVVLLQFLLGFFAVSKCTNNNKLDDNKGRQMYHTYGKGNGSIDSSSCNCGTQIEQENNNQLYNQQQEITQKNTNTKYHIVTVVQPRIYMSWQTWIQYYHFNKIKNTYPNTSFGGFTRLLVSEKQDQWMDTIPTFLVEPVDNTEIRQYSLILRPLAITAFLKSGKFQEQYLLHVDSDYIPYYPLNIQVQEGQNFKPISFEYSYLMGEQDLSILEKYNNMKIQDFSKIIQPVAGAPALMSVDQWTSICGPWYDIQIKLQKDDESQRQFGWILDMAAFALAATQLPNGPLEFQIRPNLLMHPPYDHSLLMPVCYPSKDDCDKFEPGIFFHYTYSMTLQLIDTTNGRNTEASIPWTFDKREYMDKCPKKFETPPPMMQPVVQKMIWLMNEALKEMPLCYENK